LQTFCHQLFANAFYHPSYGYCREVGKTSDDKFGQLQPMVLGGEGLQKYIKMGKQKWRITSHEVLFLDVSKISGVQIPALEMKTAIEKPPARMPRTFYQGDYVIYQDKSALLSMT